MRQSGLLQPLRAWGAVRLIAANELKRAMFGERASAGTAGARAERRIGRRRKTPDAAKYREVVVRVITGYKPVIGITHRYHILQTTIWRIVAQARTLLRRSQFSIRTRKDRRDGKR